PFTAQVITVFLERDKKMTGKPLSLGNIRDIVGGEANLAMVLDQLAKKGALRLVSGAAFGKLPENEPHYQVADVELLKLLLDQAPKKRTYAPTDLLDIRLRPMDRDHLAVLNTTLEEGRRMLGTTSRSATRMVAQLRTLLQIHDGHYNTLPCRIVLAKLLLMLQDRSGARIVAEKALA